MIFRSIVIVSIAVCFGQVTARAATEGAAASSRSGPAVPPVEAGLSAYRQYAETQANSLVGMTRVLANEIERGDLDAARSAYAPAHRYLERLAPIVESLHDLHKRMDARADDYEWKEANPSFSGFHRIEYGLFANRSTAGLSDYADRLNKDARELRDQIASGDVAPAVLVDGAIKSLEVSADPSASGDEERYSRTDLWDLEAIVDGAKQVVTLLRSQTHSPTRTNEVLVRTNASFTKVNSLLETHKVGCGFKGYDELASDDKTALMAAMTALAAQFSTLRGTLAMD